MPPTPADLALGKRLAERFAAAGNGRVRRVVMVGSRASGTAGPESDLDLVVLVETARSERPWGAADAAAERQRLQSVVGPPEVVTDLWVRTINQFEEARRVVGGVESLVEWEGVVVYSRPVGRRPIVRRTPEQVRRENVATWLHGASLRLDRAVALKNAAELTAGPAHPERDAGHYAEASMQWAINALLVVHGIRTAKHEFWDAALDRLSHPEPEITAWLRTVVAMDTRSVAAAHSVLHALVGWIGHDSGIVPYLSGIRRHLETPVVLLG